MGIACNLHPVPRPPPGVRMRRFGFNFYGPNGSAVPATVCAWIDPARGEENDRYVWRPVGRKNPIWGRMMEDEESADVLLRILTDRVCEVMDAEADAMIGRPPADAPPDDAD